MAPRAPPTQHAARTLAHCGPSDFYTQVDPTVPRAPVPLPLRRKPARLVTTRSGSLGRESYAMSTRRIDVHADELEYTSQGLRTRRGSPLPLTVGSHNVVRIVRPKRVRFLEPGVNGFAFNSSFPTPGVLQLFLIPEFRVALEESLIDARQFVRVFGHTDMTGDEAANKLVSERRAQAVVALLTGNVDMFTDLAQQEGWGLGEAQVMLRALRNDPGPADGRMGPLTARAIKVFQSQFNTGMFHRHLPSKPPPAIPVTASLDPATLLAIIDAFVSVLSLHIDESRLHPTHPIAGCSEFNRFGTDPRENRRVSIALYPTLPPHHDKAPCRTADHTVCPVQQEQQPGCLWYREHFIEQREGSLPHRHFDLRWLFVDESRAILTALTTAPDGSDVEFRVYRSAEVSKLDDISLDTLGDAMSETITGTVLNGVAYCEWSVDAEQAAFLQSDNWIVPIPFERALNEDLLSLDPSARVPVFTVIGSGSHAVSAPPLHDVCRSVLDDDHVFDGARYIWLTDMLGRVYHSLFGERTVETTARALSTAVHAAVLPLK